MKEDAAAPMGVGVAVFLCLLQGRGKCFAEDISREMFRGMRSANGVLLFDKVDR